ncbi:hypothetical protein [Pontibacter arcticus]|uniref:Lipocalin-like domain-containing protein n=1 Tax=Pontibacter arcticus TaxID=2080288 RepID=A0A364REG5_9BACT|nr:hypothetical protein [Pontibacter arcticus]RAU82730.1 hypothetical protein DP923_05595 [Pontibacter arcticus]
MKRYLSVLVVLFLFFSACKESDSPSPYNLNGLWEGSHTLTRTAGENCEAELKADQFRMIWRVDFRDTLTATEQQYSDFSKRWFNLTTTWRGTVASDSVVRVTKYYDSACNTLAKRDSVVFRGTVRLQEGYLVLNLAGNEIRCTTTDTVSCAYTSSYQIRKKIEE